MTRILTLCLAVLSFLSGCMLTPADGDVVSSTATALSFGGFTPNPGQAVRVEVLNGTTWLPVTTTTSSSTPFRFDGTDLYSWSASATVGSWVPGTTGFVTRVRAIVTSSDGSTNNAYTFTPTWSTCLNENPTLSGFLSRCTSKNSPNAFVYTRDYPAGLDLTITNMWFSGRLNAVVRNAGRPGTLQSVTCWRSGAAVVKTVNERILPGESKTIDLSLVVSPGQTATCEAQGVNEDGSAEANTSNNQRTQVF